MSFESVACGPGADVIGASWRKSPTRTSFWLACIAAHTICGTYAMLTSSNSTRSYCLPSKSLFAYIFEAVVATILARSTARCSSSLTTFLIWLMRFWMSRSSGDDLIPCLLRSFLFFRSSSSSSLSHGRQLRA